MQGRPIRARNAFYFFLFLNNYMYTYGSKSRGLCYHYNYGLDVRFLVSREEVFTEQPRPHIHPYVRTNRLLKAFAIARESSSSERVSHVCSTARTDRRSANTRTWQTRV